MTKYAFIAVFCKATLGKKITYFVRMLLCIYCKIVHEISCKICWEFPIYKSDKTHFKKEKKQQNIMAISYIHHMSYIGNLKVISRDLVTLVQL